MLFSRSHRAGSLALVIASATFACGGGDGPTEPTAGTLAVTTTTFGLEPDPDGYTVQVDAAPPQAIGVDATIRSEGVTGDHTIQLGGVADNCTVSTQNPRTVSITPGQTVAVSFTVTCNATTGNLQVTSSTSGSSPDPDGYTITLDGTDRGTLGTSAGVSVAGLPPGDHTVGLSGIVANCQVQGSNPRTVTVPAGENATAAFAVVCAAPPPSVGILRIVTTTNGPDPDPDGYTFAVDGGASQPIGLSATATLANVAASAHAVRLGGVAANCAVQAGNPRSIAVSAGATTDVSFAVTCSPTTGTIQVSATTSGSPLDPDGYLAKLDGGDTGQPVSVNGGGTFSSVPAGDHTVMLTGVAPNCVVAEGTSRNVSVSAGADAPVVFSVACTDATGSIHLSVATTGESSDPDGYTVTVDGSASQSVAATGDVTIEGLAPGSHTVALANLASNCRVDGDHPRSIVVASGSAAEAAFTVTCRPDTSLRWAPMDGSGDDISGTGPSDIFTVTGPTASVHHYDGQRWSEQFRPQEGYALEAVWANTSTDVYAAGNSFGTVNGDYIGYAPIFHYNGSGWSEVARFLPEEFADRAIFYGLWGASATDIFAVGGHELEKSYRTLIVHFDGTAWTTMAAPEEEARLFDVWGTSGSDVYAVGVRGYLNPVGVVLRYDGTAWTRMRDLPQGTQALGVWGSSSSDIFVVGPRGSILHYDGTAWSSMPIPVSPSVQLSDIWGTSATDVFAVGTDVTTGTGGIILHYDGTGWTQQTSGTTIPLYGVWGSSSTDVFATGGGIVLHGTR